MKNLFYILKPIIPRILQIFLRRKLVKKQREKHKDIWPILRSAAEKPLGWTGWPKGKKFAFVLTHDVEHQKGYNSVLKLMQIEKDLGFISSFYFVPERDYVIDLKLLNILKTNGFEYGIHGLCHDGKLFSSEREFLKRANRINDYLKKWNCVGFRAPSMHHNLEWINELNIEYDLSTFDTDPFEPQSDGVGTIYPYWVPNKRYKNSGFVEMPYTLTQDFTLFILMQEKTINIWQKKTDWIVDNGGMVLVNVHPDYINFSKNSNSTEQFNINIYKKFLEYIKNNYNGNYWNPLPMQLAKFTKQSIFAKSLQSWKT